MLFNSIDFAIFLPLVFALYWFVFNRNLKLQNIFICLASYIFYAWWDWRFLSLILVSSLTDYLVGLKMEQAHGKTRKLLLLISLAVNLGLLGYFKYFNFFVESFIAAFSLCGYTFQAPSLNIVLPVGISFYTFQTLSYTLDIYRKKTRPTTDLVAFFAFVSFFPQLVAGPIERATNLLPQVINKRSFEYGSATEGLRQILWGLFKKVVIADNCAIYADLVFASPESYNAAALWVGSIFFGFQIYADFSGYSDIAIGTARLFGFKLKQNFAYPYFSRNMAEFWRRWHISLSSWVRDYLYFPLGGSRKGPLHAARNTLIIFLIIGFWHGANWTFVFYGFIHALLVIPHILIKPKYNPAEIVAQGHLLPTLADFGRILLNYLLLSLARVFFRSESISFAFSYLKDMLTPALFSMPNLPRGGIVILGLVGLFFLAEWFSREHSFPLARENLKFPRLFRWLIYSFIITLIILYADISHAPFIYFDF